MFLCSVFPGRWLGPSTGCRALESAASSSDALKGLKIVVLGGTGGGAPVLGIDRYLSCVENSHADGSDHTMAVGGSDEARSTALPTAAAIPEVDKEIDHEKITVENKVEVDEEKTTVEDNKEEEAEAEAEKTVEIIKNAGGVVCDHPLSEGQKEATVLNGKIEKNADNNESNSGLLLFIPLVLGIGKLNPVYFPQLHAVLAMPHSVGIVGGRPGSSVYVVGCQGESLLYLDPHTIQPAATDSSDWETCSCDVLRTMWLSSLDPSLALGFYCKNKDEYLDLCDRLKELEEEHSGMPLVCVREGMGGGVNGDEGDELGEGAPQDWEEDEMEESTENEEEEEESFDQKEQGVKGSIDKGGLVEEERQDSEFSEVPMMGRFDSGNGLEVAEIGEEEEEEEIQRRISELRQQSSKSVWELV